MPSGSHTVPSLIQGISQQAEIARALASAKDQENCLNEVLDGAASRMGSVVRFKIPFTHDDPFVYEIRRSGTERYLVLAEGGSLRVYNKDTGQAATITNTGGAYLTHTGAARKAFTAVTIGDTTFLINRQKTVQMATTKSAVRGNWACAHFKAGGYKVTYTLSIIVGGNKYSATYTTPDNSSAGNAQYITTDHLAEQFRLGLINTIFPALAGDGHTGFSVARYGSTLIIKRSSQTAFDITTTDGIGDQHFISFKDNVKSLSDLPAKCEDGYQVSVSGNAGPESSKYFLKYSGEEHTGRWEEVVKWDTKTHLDANTMPHVLKRTGLNTFTFGPVTWGARLAGDGANTAKDPSFVGNAMSSGQKIGGRLALTTDYEMTLSRSRNAFVFFPDTVQTNLDTAPIDYDVSNGSTTDIFHAVVVGEKIQFWGDKQQTYLSSGQDPIREDTTEVLPMSNYEYDGEVAPVPAGLASLVFGTAVGNWQKLVEVFFNQGRTSGEIEISSHVPKLIKGKLRHLAVGEAAKKTFVFTDGSPNEFYLYQWYNQEDARVQSAWCRWNMPAPDKVIWGSVEGSTLNLLLKWGNSVTYETLELDSTGDEKDQRFPLRLDHRVSEASATWDGEKFILTLPYVVQSAKRSSFHCVERLDVQDFSQRGRKLPIKWVNSTTVEVTAPSNQTKFYFGSIPVARRRQTRFYARDRSDTVMLHDRLLIRDIVVSHKDSSTYKVVVTKFGPEEVTKEVIIQEWSGRLLGDPTVLNDQVPIKTGSFRAKVGEETENVEIDLVNDTVFPAIWTAARYTYEITVREGS
ncbi:hypothetical protein H7H48_15855 [Nitratireductor sp. B36]|uniref:phage nozzle protein n=1 Tax=Nitratireductor sp. B36 TaxID=2762059 RepID=UPI001E58506E|nr:hypothetical protein [Nitratireductor sp. B36]MCC5780536.1 hypothetical protein [Nitratireductor sp. B36]